MSQRDAVRISLNYGVFCLKTGAFIELQAKTNLAFDPNMTYSRRSSMSTITNIYKEDIDFAALALQDADFAKV